MTRADWVTVVLVLHVVGAIVALGFSLTYGLWGARGDRAGAVERVFALRTISWIDRRFTTPAYVLQAVTGFILVSLIGWSLLKESWLEISIGIYVALTVLAITVYAPAHRRQTLLAEHLVDEAGAGAAYTDAAAKARAWGVVVTILTVAIVVLMVWKPTFW
jgi:uncharacterized membrane protein